MFSKNWNNKKQEIKSQVQQSSLINKTLNNIKVAENCYWKLVNEGEYIDNNILKERINNELSHSLSYHFIHLLKSILMTTSNLKNQPFLIIEEQLHW